MPLVETEDAARRLSRAIVIDIRLHNGEKIEAGADLTAEIEEGRKLFRSRVDRSLHHVYEEVVAEAGWRSAGAHAARREAPVQSEEAPRRLARAIVVDIRLYNAEAIGAGADLSTEIEEGRALFRSRAEQSLHHLYEEAIAEAELPTAGAALPTAGAESPAAGAPALRREPPSPVPKGLFESELPSADPSRWPLIVLGLAVALAIAAWLVTH